MRICFISSYDGYLDEGMKNVAFNLGHQLSHRHDVSYLNISRFASRDFWKSLKQVNPQIVHYTHGPSLNSLALLRIVRLFCNNSFTVVSATQPRITGVAEKFVSLFKPDLVLTQSTETENLFRRLNCRTCFVPNGVDTERFVPVQNHVKMELREKYGVDRDKYVILHVGTLGERRNLSVLESIQNEGDNQVIVVGSLANPVDSGITGRLEQAGCLVWRTYFERVEDIYALSDCYIFPVSHRLGSVEFPLSVLEAMACNLPVIATRFGGLPAVIGEGDGFYFADDEKAFSEFLSELQTGNKPVNTREQVLPHSWENIASEVERLYDALVES